MVSPSPDLQRKINNTDNIVKAKKSHLVSNLSKKHPADYIDLDIHNKLSAIKPWIEDDTIKKISPTFQISPTSLDTNIKNLWGPFFSTIDNVLVLCVDFSDSPSQTSISTINNRFFSTSNTPPLSFLKYFKENSYNKWIPRGEVHGWYRAPNPRTYYINNNWGYGTYPNNSKRLVEDTIDVALLDPNIDWSLFDTNNNNIIDSIIVVHSGAEAAWSGSTSLFWAHASSMTSTKTVNTVSGTKSINRYVFTAEYTFPGASQRIGIDCHEFGHTLNLPDLYDTTNNSNGVGNYSLMGIGCWANNGITPVHLDAWSKYKLGFMDITKNPQGLITLNNVETTADAIKYTTSDPKEYFLIENRQKTSFDTYVPADGLLIWRINENKSNNNDKTCYLVGLVQADNLKDLENKVNNGDAGDSFPGSTNKRSFGSTTSPNSILCNSSVRDMTITSISNSSNSMTFNATVPEIVQSAPPNCALVTVVSPAHIEATTMTIDKSSDPCLTGNCTVTVNVTWRNSGGVAGTFTPTILIDNNPITSTQVTLNAFETVGDSTIVTFTVSNLLGGTHAICPNPN